MKEGAALDVSAEAKRSILGMYRFALAFENTIARDYVSEKVFDALAADTLPIYYGTRDVYKLLPCTHCIIHVFDFTSPHELAVYLHELLEDHAKYEEYFAWKRAKVIPPSFNALMDYCRLNDDLNPVCMVCAYVRGIRTAKAPAFINENGC